MKKIPNKNDNIPRPHEMSLKVQELARGGRKELSTCIRWWWGGSPPWEFHNYVLLLLISYKETNLAPAPLPAGRAGQNYRLT